MDSVYFVYFLWVGSNQVLQSPGVGQEADPGGQTGALPLHPGQKQVPSNGLWVACMVNRPVGQIVCILGLNLINTFVKMCHPFILYV